MQDFTLSPLDTRREAFALECQRQSRLLSNDLEEAQTLDWLGAAADIEGWK